MTRENESFRILIVDDNLEIRMVLEEHLREEGYLTDGAGSGPEALQKYEKRAYDLIVTDLNMPEMTGIQLIKEMGKKENSTEFIIITGYAALDTAIEAVKAGAFDYLVKPFRIEELTVVIKNARDKILLKKANKQLFDKLKGFYGEISRYKQWLNDEEKLAHLAPKELDT